MAWQVLISSVDCNNKPTTTITPDISLYSSYTIQDLLNQSRNVNSWYYFNQNSSMWFSTSISFKSSPCYSAWTGSYYWGGPLMPSWIVSICFWRFPFRVYDNAHCVHGNFWPSWIVFMCFWRFPFLVNEDPQWLHWNFCPSLFMYWFFVSLKVSFLSCFVFTIRAWELLPFMDWVYVSLKTSFQSCFVFTMWAWDLLAFMNWFYVSS